MSDQPVTPDREARGAVVRSLRQTFYGHLERGLDLEAEIEHAATNFLPLLTEALDRARQQGNREGRQEAETMRGDVHHHLNPLIGFLRYDVHYGQTSDGRRQHLIDRMYACMDAADAILGEKPMREQLDDLRAGLALARGGPNRKDEE